MMVRSFLATLALLASLVTAQAATLLPNGKQTFVNANGAPLAGGSVTFYIPGTTTLKTTWKDSAQTIQNTNPVALDIAGTAIIYGSGCYRQIVKDSGGNTIWDQPTCDTASTALIWAGRSGGTANSQTLTASNFSSQDGQTIGFIASATNTGAEGLIVNGGSPINVLKDTSTGSFSLSGGEIFSGNVITVTYDATRGAFHLANNPVIGAQPKATLASSGTTDLGGAASHYIQIDGTSTITSFGSSASTSFPLYTLLFSNTATLASSANLRVPSNQDIVTANGDSALAAYQGSGVWIVLSYSRSNGGVVNPLTPVNFSATCPMTTPVSASGLKPNYMEIELWGGGGGGGGNGNDGSNGGTTTFDTITANGGAGGVHSVNAFGVDGGQGGGGGTGGVGAVWFRGNGEHGQGSPATEGAGGVGASVGIGGAGGRSSFPSSTAGSSSPANTSARTTGQYGGGGAGYTGVSTSIAASSGGGGGEYVRAIYHTPLADSYSCTIGAGGTGGTSAGNGGAGGILIHAFWN